MRHVIGRLSCRGKRVRTFFAAGLLLVMSLILVKVAFADAPPATDLLAQANAAFDQRSSADTMDKAISYYQQCLPMLPPQSQSFVLDRLAQCYYELTTFSPGDTENDKKLFAQGKDYGLRSLRLNSNFARLEKDNFLTAVSYVTDPAALLWTANNWGALFHYNPLQGMVDVGKVKALYERGIEIDETYWGASFDNALGAMLVTLPSFLGGDPDQGKAHLERAIALAPDYLENHVVYAQYWGFTYDMLGKMNGIRDLSLIQRELQFVISAPIGYWPFWNREAKKGGESLATEKPGDLRDMNYFQHNRARAVSLALVIVVGTFLVDSVVASASENIFLHGANRPVLNIAHAGAASIAPQNTIITGEKALAAGADLWGIDTRITKDGVFILMHDKTLTRTTNAKEVFPDRSPWAVKDFTLAEVERLDAGSWFVRTDPFGQIKGGNVSVNDQHSYVGEKVPTLREALEFTKAHHWRMDIEVKPMDYLTPAQIAEKLVALIHATGMGDWVMVSSFDHRILVQVKKLDPAIPTAALVVFPPIDPVGYLEKIGADGYEPSPIAINADIAAGLGKQGFGVYVWTYNSVDQLRHFATMPGIAGIYTDFPQRLEPILEEIYGPPTR